MAKLKLLNLPTILKRTPPPLNCSGCIHGKRVKAPHHPAKHDYAIGKSVSSDIAGPIAPKSYHGNQYFAIFLETRTRFLIVFCAASRTEITNFTSIVLNMMKTKFGSAPMLLTTDNAGEYTSKRFVTILNSHGTEQNTPTPYSPQENSLAERVIGTLSRIVRSYLNHSQLPNEYWEDALRDAVFKYNRSLHKTTRSIPYTEWHGTPPTIRNMLTFGQLGSIPVITDTTSQSKLDARGVLVRYMFGVSNTHIVIRDITTNKYRKIRAIDFKPYSPSMDPVRTTAAAFKAFTPTPTPKTIGPSSPPPLSRKQAHRYPDANSWAEAHNAEIDKLDEIGVVKWLPKEELPPKLIPLTMKYRYKRDADDNITQRKARLAVRGDLMTPHTHFDPDHTSAHLAQKDTVRLVFAITAAKNLHIEHFDITTAYPHELYRYEKPVYVKQHPLFDGSFKHDTPGGQLVRNLYGNPSGFFYYLEGAVACLQSLNYKQSQDDPCLFVKHDAESFTIVCLNSDDYLVASTHTTHIDTLFSGLSAKYNIRRIGQPVTYLGWKIHYTKNEIHLSQPNYITQALSIAQLSDCNPRQSPHPCKAKFHPPNENDTALPTHNEIYRQLVGLLRWIADCTRPDIAFATSRLAQALTCTTERHWNHLKEVLRYLKGTPNHGLTYSRNGCLSSMHLSFKAFADADFATDDTNRKSVSGFVLTMSDGPISWKSAQQPCVALSTAEAEYIAATSAVQTICFIRRVLDFLHLGSRNASQLFVDNQSVLAIGHNTGEAKRRKFIDLRHHYLRDHLQRGNISLHYVRSAQNLADIFTKSLGRIAFLRMRDALNINPPNVAVAGSGASGGVLSQPNGRGPT